MSVALAVLYSYGICFVLIALMVLFSGSLWRKSK